MLRTSKSINLKTKIIVGLLTLTLVAGGAVYAAAEYSTEPKRGMAPQNTVPASEIQNLSREAYTEAEFTEYNLQTGQMETKSGYIYKTNDTGISKRIDNSVMRYVGDRRDETEALLTHSYQVIDAYAVGTAPGQGYGDFAIDEFDTEHLLTADWKQFKELYDDELKSAKTFVEAVSDEKPIPWGRKSQGQLLSIVYEIDRAYSGAIDNLNWSNTEPPDETGINEEEEYRSIREIAYDSRFMRARDLMQRYVTYMFGNKMTIEGVTPEELPIPEEYVSPHATNPKLEAK